LVVIADCETVVETPGFLRDASKAMTETERIEVVSFLAANPDAGDIMPDTGGARKLRWKAEGRGERGEVANLTRAERNEMKSLLPRLVAGYQKRMTK
jgi:hypothetical protein